MAKKRFRRTPEEIELGLTVDQAKAYRKGRYTPEQRKRFEEVASEIKEQNAQLQEVNDKKKVGLGDVVETITKSTGIKAFVEYLNGGKECGGCKKRKEFLNNIRLSRRNPLPLTVSEYEWLQSFFNRQRKNEVKATEVMEVTKIHARVFKYKMQPPTNCSSCLRQKVDDLAEIYNAYNNKL